MVPVLAVLLLVAVGCNKKQQGPSPVAPSVAAKPKVIVQKPVSSVGLQSAQTNTFDFSTRKDPFKPYVSVKAATPAELTKQRREMKPVLPLHSFDVNEFKLIGAIIDPKGNKAMVKDPGGKGYVLKVGMTIGKNEGKIVRIDLSGVDVVEQFRDENSKIRKETVRIPLLRKP
jgi:type IV pilus assembly protein PilP